MTEQNETSEVTEAVAVEKPSLEQKYQVLTDELRILADSLGVNILFAAHFTDEKQIATNYIGVSDYVVELGLKKALELNN